MKIVAIDFETANYSPLSACALGLAIFEDHKLVESPYWLIKPPKGHGWFRVGPCKNTRKFFSANRLQHNLGLQRRRQAVRFDSFSTLRKTLPIEHFCDLAPPPIMRSGRELLPQLNDPARKEKKQGQLAGNRFDLRASKHRISPT